MPRKSKAERRQEARNKPETRPLPTFRPRSQNQAKYLRAIQSSHITICTGYPGTGKTFLAVAEACRMLTTNQINKIILSRPVIEAGERLGFLPGKLEEKAKPYLMPIFDILKQFFSYQQITTMQNSGVLEISPLAYMRGRTFTNSVVILDEAQNANLKQFKMLLTRIGPEGKIIICGDTKQSDIDADDLSALVETLKGVDRITSVQMQKEDIVRHPLIAVIVDRIEELEYKLAHPPIIPYSGNGNGHRLQHLV